MPQRWITPGLKTRLAFGMIFLFVQPDVSATAAGAQQIGGVIIPQAFSQALQDGMSVPLYIHLAGSQSTRDDQRIGSAFIWLDGGVQGKAQPSPGKNHYCGNHWSLIF